MTSHVYLGIGACGCVRAMVIDEPQRPGNTASTVAEFIRDGLTIERATTEDGKRRFLISCDVCRARDRERRAKQVVLL